LQISEEAKIEYSRVQPALKISGLFLDMDTRISGPY
jgi:hypothetical protein